MNLAWDNGTSFAAPLVAGQAAELFHAFPKASSNLIKALLCHHTTEAHAPAGVADPTCCIGFGEPNIAPILSAPLGSACYFHVGKLVATRYGFIPFHVPAALAAGKSAVTLRIRCTLVYNPPTDLNTPQEYSKSRVGVTLRKPAEVGHADVSLSGHMKSYEQYNPIIHFDRRFSHSYNTGTWELRLRLWTRDLPDGFEQDYAVLIEVMDEHSGVDVWQAVKDEVGTNYVPLVLNVAA